jgi:hypothetical protein
LIPAADLNPPPPPHWFAGTIQPTYEVYESLSRKESAIARIGCLVYATLSVQALRKFCLRPFMTRFARFTKLKTRCLRNVTTNAVSKPLKSEPDESLGHGTPTAFLPQSTMGKASTTSSTVHALTGYLEDGRFEIDNNSSKTASVHRWPQALALH